MTQEEREERLKKICSSVNSGDFGGKNKDALHFLGSNEVSKVERFGSGCPSLDDAMGGGYPRGRWIEIHGNESSGKSTLTLHAIANFQKKWPDEDIALIDSEFSFDQVYAQALGVNTKFLIINQPESADQALNIIKELAENGIKLIIVDSVAALSPKEEQDGNLGDAQVAIQARKMSSALRQLTSFCGKRDVTIIFTNQLRENIGVSYGDKTVTPAGRALKHYASIRLSIVRTGSEKQTVGGEKINISNQVKVTVKKNKTAAPFKIARFTVTYGFGIDLEAAYLDQAIKQKVVTKTGGWHSFNGNKIANGRINVLDILRNDSELMEDIKRQIKESNEIDDNLNELRKASNSVGEVSSRGKRLSSERSQGVTVEDV